METPRYQFNNACSNGDLEIAQHILHLWTFKTPII